MSESDRILRAMTTMEEFTVADLVGACQASPSTVRTVLRRKSDYLEVAGVDEADRPGGRWKRYRLRPAARRELDTALPPEPVPVPDDLLAAEELLLSPRAIEADAETRGFPPAPSPRPPPRWRGARRSGLQPAVGVHLGAVDALIALVEGEAVGDAGALGEVHARDRGAEPPSSLAGMELGASLERRLERSPLSAPSPALADDDRRSPEVARALGEITR